MFKSKEEKFLTRLYSYCQKNNISYSVTGVLDRNVISFMAKGNLYEIWCGNRTGKPSFIRVNNNNMCKSNKNLPVLFLKTTDEWTGLFLDLTGYKSKVRKNKAPKEVFLLKNLP